MSRSEQFYESQKAHRYFGSNDIDHLFPDGKPLTVVPWEQMGRRKDRQDYDRGLVRATLAKPPSEHEFEEIDPRTLHATQPSIVRDGVSHYLEHDYRTGNRPTYADQDMVGNRHPVVYRRADLHGREPQNLLLSGHHRAAATLLQGRQFRARVIEGGWGPMRTDDPPSLVREHPKMKDIR